MSCIARRVLASFAAVAVFASLATAAPPVPQTPEQLQAHYDAAMAEADLAIEAIVAVPDDRRTFENTVLAIDDMHARLDAAIGMPLFMAYVHPDATIRDVSRAAYGHYGNWMVELGKREDLYDAVRQVAMSNPELEGENARLMTFTMRDYRRSGMDLDPEARAKLAAVEKEINELSIEFDQNIMADETVVFVTEDELRGLPADWLAARTQVDGLYELGMDYPTILPILDHSPNADTRQKIWLARKRRAKRNVAILEKLLALRAEQAAMLGYAHASDYENEVRMTKNADTVAAFYARLQPLLREKALKDHALMLEAKRSDTGDPQAQLKPWDFGYYMERVRERDYEVDSNVVREYFPLEKVRDGLFEITQQLYGIDYVPKQAPANAPLWHEDVEYYEVVDRNTGATLGEFFMDMYPRDGKYGHAAQWGLVPRKAWTDNSVQTPVAGVVCNFPKPTADQPSLLSHDQAETFFHEFGHCLHTLMTEAKTARFAGTSVERDFVEAPSQMFEAWVWSPETLPMLSGHYKTGEPLPADLLERMIAAKTLCSGMMDETQVFYGMSDQAFHTDADGTIDTTQVGKDLYAECTLFEPVDGTWFQSSFGHLTGYQGGYYGYLWSKVFAKDMEQRFEELGMLDPEAGAYYRKHVLGRGGTVDASEMLQDYLGREPRMEPYIRSLGIEVEQSDQQ
ncbi:MAG: Zn-dependent oligopeptidase [Phycisphaerales bacterium]|nr:Zn-dependent oligopeptidase [Phycisphaerales bacterium]